MRVLTITVERNDLWPRYSTAFTFTQYMSIVGEGHSSRVWPSSG